MDSLFGWIVCSGGAGCDQQRCGVHVLSLCMAMMMLISRVDM